jgi:hypothetical protein
MHDSSLQPSRDEADWTLRAAVRALGPWLLVGFALRLLLLPACMHPDLLSVYDRVRLLHEGAFRLSDYSFQALPLLLHDLWARACGVTLPDFSGVRWPNPTEGEIFDQTRHLLAEPQALVWLALWKLPYLVCDLLVGCAIAWSVPRRHAVYAGALWMLHPLALYASSVFAKYEPFMLLPLVLGLGSLLRGRTTRGALLLGIAGALRLYPLMLVLPLALAAETGARKRSEFVALAALPLVCVLGASAGAAAWAWWIAVPLAAGSWWAYTRVRGTRGEWFAAAVLALVVCVAAPRIFASLFDARYSIEQVFHHSSFLTESLDASSAAEAGVLSPFLLGYGLLLLWVLRRSSEVGAAARANFVLDTALLAAACFYGLSFFHPQYIALLAAIACLSLHRAPGFAAAHGLQIVGALLLLLAFPGGHTTVQLFLPLSPADVGSLPEPAAVMPRALAALPWPGLGRTLLALGGVWIAIEVLRAARNDSAVEPARTSRWLLYLGIGAWPAALVAYLVCCAQPSVTSLRPTGAELGSSTVKGQGAVQFTLGDRAPAGLLVSTTAAPSGPALWRVQFFADGAAPGAPAAEVLLTDDELRPGSIEGLAPGTLQIPLDRVKLDPHVHYRTVLLRETPAAVGEQRVQALERVAAADLLLAVNDRAYLRFEQARVSLSGPPVHAAGAPYEVGGGLPLRTTWFVLLGASALAAAAWFARRGLRKPRV